MRKVKSTKRLRSIKRPASRRSGKLVPVSGEEKLHLVANLRRIMKERGIKTNIALARLVDAHESTVGHWLNPDKKTMPTGEHRKKLLDALGVSENEVFTAEEDPRTTIARMLSELPIEECKMIRDALHVYSTWSHRQRG